MSGSEFDELDFEIAGDTIKFMWDYGVVVPLWTEWEGLVPEEPEWLRRALGLSDPLIADLTAWGEAMQYLDSRPHERTDEAYRDLDLRARALLERVQQEVGDRFRVWYHPW
ncbi:hypothetical protein [Nocardioides sp.]|uniref:hypothetical protein n=1 Tax=Nocardioides sp. TaxID=35761 RepID=UPI003518A706